MTERKAFVKIERTVGYICDVCHEGIDEDEGRGALYQDHPDKEWEQQDFCTKCYGLVVDTITDVEKHRNRYPEEYV